jgi:hypothetical protein
MTTRNEKKGGGEMAEHNYTGYGVEGEKYQEYKKADIKDLAKMIRKQAKATFPECKFSVRISRFSMGQSMTISLMAAPFEAFAPENENVEDGWRSGYAQLNHYNLEGPRNNGAILTPEALHAIKTVVGYAEDYNFSDCDGQIDYFNVNFYLHVQIGEWNKNFVNTTKK